MILPLVKKHVESGGICAVPEKLTCSYSCELGKQAAAALVSFNPEIESVKGGGFIEFFSDTSLDPIDEIYSVSVAENKIRVGFRDARGAVNGAATVALLLRKKELRCCEIIDYPSTSLRSFLLDMARGLPTEDDIMSTIKYMALAKYNRLHLHLIDAKGPCYVSEALPEFKYTGESEMCSLDFLRKIEEVCASYAIEIVPELEIPAHSTAICKSHPEFKCPIENNDGWAICPASEGVWDFYDKLVNELCLVFPRSEYIHIGTDELEFGDLDIKYHCFWGECPDCAELRKREGLSDIQDEFYYVVNKIYEIIKSHGKKVMMWNDQIDVSRDVPLSRDILIEFWRIAYPGRGPHEGCTFNGFLEKGFKVLNAFYPWTYLNMEHYLSPEKMRTWTPYSVPEQSPEYASQIVGGETCAWEFGNYSGYPFYGYITPPVLAVFGDKLWGLGEREQNGEYREALAEYLFGSAELVDVFDIIGDIIPPRKPEAATYRDSGSLSAEAIESCIARLEKSREAVSVKYVDLLGRILNEVKA